MRGSETASAHRGSPSEIWVLNLVSLKSFVATLGRSQGHKIKLGWLEEDT